MSVPERIKRMSIIPNGEPRTNLGARQHLLFFCNSEPAKGALHLSVNIDRSTRRGSLSTTEMQPS